MSKIQLTLFASPVVSAVTRANENASENNSEPSINHSINHLNADLLTISSQSTYDFSVARGSTSAPIITEYDADQIIELEMADGGMLYMRLDELQLLVQQYNPLRNQARSTIKNAFEISSTTALSKTGKANTSRGFVADFIKSISFLDIQWSCIDKDTTASSLANRLAKHLVTKLDAGKEGLLTLESFH